MLRILLNGIEYVVLAIALAVVLVCILFFALPPSVGADVRYIPPDEIEWQLEKSSGDELITVNKTARGDYEFEILETKDSKLSIFQKQQYPITFYEKVPVCPDCPEYKWVQVKPSGSIIPKSVLNLESDNKYTLSKRMLDELGPNIAVKFGHHSSTYNPVTNTIIVTGTENDLFEAIYTADVANGWGVVTKSGSCTDCYCFDAIVQIGDGATATAVADKNCIVTFTDNIATANNTYFLNCMNNSTATFGTLVDADRKQTKEGIMWHIEESGFNSNRIGASNAGANLYIYSGAFSGVGQKGYIINADRVWNVAELLDTGLYSCVDTYNVTSQDNNEGVLLPSGDIDRMLITNCRYGIYFGGAADYTVTNTTIESSTSEDIRTFAYNGNATMLDCTLDDWDFSWGGANSGTITRSYSVELVFNDDVGSPISNVDVSWVDDNGTTVQSVVTGASGTTPSVNLINALYNQANGNTPILHTPHTLTATHVDYGTYTAVVTIDEPIDWEIAMIDACSTSADTDYIVDWIEEYMEVIMLGIMFAILIVGLAVGGYATRHRSLLFGAAFMSICMASWAYTEIEDGTVYQMLFWAGVALTAAFVLDQGAMYLRKKPDEEDANKGHNSDEKPPLTEDEKYSLRMKQSAKQYIARKRNEKRLRRDFQA